MDRPSSVDQLGATSADCAVFGLRKAGCAHSWTEPNPALGLGMGRATERSVG
jgi:hypothetical protein